MKKINNSDFELLKDIIKNLDIKSRQESSRILEQLKSYWQDILGKKISKLSKVYDYSAGNVLTVVCADSFIANELYFEKDRLINYMSEKTDKLGIIIKDIKFDYMKWKENDDE
ncbi:MAG: DUF721 domain-containing protein [Candidatus Gastranaerophilales bacterium]|nr:DUF721 domain-containing protein [Candidatus Gastranaerophilales bacterium]